MRMNTLERNTILAALRSWQCLLETGKAPSGDRLLSIFEIARGDSGGFHAHTNAVDMLCDRIREAAHSPETKSDLDYPTILAALRYWQSFVETGAAPSDSHVKLITDIAGDGLSFASPEDIDELCETINTSLRAPETSQKIDVDLAEAACRALVEAYEHNPEEVDWEDVQKALEHALKALHLPEDHLDQFIDYEETPSGMAP